MQLTLTIKCTSVFWNVYLSLHKSIDYSSSLISLCTTYCSVRELKFLWTPYIHSSMDIIICGQQCRGLLRKQKTEHGLRTIKYTKSIYIPAEVKIKFQMVCGLQAKVI